MYIYVKTVLYRSLCDLCHFAFYRGSDDSRMCCSKLMTCRVSGHECRDVLLVKNSVKFSDGTLKVLFNLSGEEMTT